MAEIHYAIHIILGVIVTAASFLNPSMRIFIFVGILFVIWGLIKAFRKKPKVEKKDTKPKQEFNPDHYKRCPNCGAVVPKIHRFCPYCGYGV